MKRYFCDKCGKEITEKQHESPYIWILKGNDNFAEQVALCDECEDEFIKWLGEKNEICTGD